MFKVVTASTTSTMDIGNVITAQISIPTGYEYVAFRDFSPSDWTVVLQKIIVNSNKVNVECRKMISGSSNVTLSASIICRKI